jgi:tRNA pseudouridine55 synthase
MSTNPDISGMIPILKPRGMTSKDVSRILLRRFGRLKIGHVGTLDPDADGVLPILIGRGTKLQDYLLDLDKAYSFDLKLGESTTTLDATGETTKVMPWPHVNVGQISKVLQNFMGTIVQVPPLYSAVKYQGKELYKYAHKGQSAKDIPLEELQRRVVIKDITVDRLDLPFISMTVFCGKGTYVRTLAADIAEALGTVGHVTRLSRIKSAGMSLSDCLTIEQAVSPARSLESLVVSMDKLSIGLSTWVPSDMVLLRRITDGQRVIVTGLACNTSRTGERFEILMKNFDGASVGIVDVEPLVDGAYKLHLKRGL